jgi:hypothetical protein
MISWHSIEAASYLRSKLPTVPVFFNDVSYATFYSPKICDRFQHRHAISLLSRPIEGKKNSQARLDEGLVVCSQSLQGGPYISWCVRCREYGIDLNVTSVQIGSTLVNVTVTTRRLTKDVPKHHFILFIAGALKLLSSSIP